MLWTRSYPGFGLDHNSRYGVHDDASAYPHTKEVKTLMQSAKTAADHEALAAHYEEDAKMLEEKAEEHKKILSEYQEKPYLYGKGYIGFDVHCQRLIDLYTKGAQQSLEMAKMHRQMAEGMQ